MSSPQPLRLGIVGAGANTRAKHIPGFQALDGVSVDVVCNRSEASSRAAADAFGIPRIAATWQDVVNDPAIDAICIGTWPYLHAPISIAALRAGKHVLTEARMAMNATEAAEMHAVAQSHPDRVAQIVPSPFTLPWDKTIARLIATGELGDLREISFIKTLPATAQAAAPLNWRSEAALSGHNTMMLGIYYEPIQRWIAARPSRVWAHGKVHTTARTDPATGESRPIEIPESLTVIAECPDGPQLTGYLNSIESGRGRDGYVINGTKATLALDFAAGELRLTPHGGSETLVDVHEEDRGSWQVEAEFVASIRDGRPVTHTSFADGLDYMRFTTAVHTSFTSGGMWVDR